MESNENTEKSLWRKITSFLGIAILGFIFCFSVYLAQDQNSVNRELEANTAKIEALTFEIYEINSLESADEASEKANEISKRLEDLSNRREEIYNSSLIRKIINSFTGD